MLVTHVFDPHLCLVACLKGEIQVFLYQCCVNCHAALFWYIEGYIFWYSEGIQNGANPGIVILDVINPD